MSYPQHWSAVRPGPTTAGPPSSTLARIRAEGTRRGLYAASPVPPPPPPAQAAPIGLAPARTPTSLSSVPATPQAAEARWASDAALRSEFRESKSRYLAFCRAAAAGRVRIAGGRVVTGS